MSPMALFSAITLVVTSIVAAFINAHIPVTEGTVATPYVEEAGAAPRARPSAITMAVKHHERITSEIMKPLQERPRLEFMSRRALPRERHVSYAILERTDTASAWMPFEIREEITEHRFPRSILVKALPDDRKAEAAPRVTYVHLAAGRIDLDSGEIQLRLRGVKQDAWLSPKEALPRLRLLR